MRTRAVFSSATAAAVALSMGLAAPVFASSPGRAAGAIRIGGRAVASRIQRSATPTATSPNFAGYEIQAGGKRSWKVAAQFVVPKITCSGGKGSPERAIDPSVGVYPLTTHFSSAGVFVGCYKGNAYYFLAFVVDGSAHNYSKLAVRPGDTVAVRVSQTSKSTVVSAADKSLKLVKKTLKGAGSKGGGSPWVGDSGWDNPGLLGVPNFGKMHFSNATLNGAPFGSAGGSALVRYNRVKGTTTQIATGALAGNEAFKTVFKHS